MYASSTILGNWKYMYNQNSNEEVEDSKLTNKKKAKDNKISTKQDFNKQLIKYKNFRLFTRRVGEISQAPEKTKRWQVMSECWW